MAAFWIFLGNIAETEPRGIFGSRFNTETGTLGPVRLAGAAQRPNFLALHPNGRFLYAVTAAKVDAYEGAVEAFAIDLSSGTLKWLNRQASGGENPAHLAVDPTGQLVVVANYDGATVAAFPIAADGRLQKASATVRHVGSSVNPERQSKPFPHGVTFDRTGKYVFITDLGVDRIFAYQVDAARGTLAPSAASPAAVVPGSGPRHITFDRDGRFAYVINELTSTITVFACQASLCEIQTLAPWAGKNAISNTGAEIEIHPNGRWLYASNRGYDSLAICSIDPVSGKLALAGEQPTLGKAPRHFAIDPTGQYLIAANLRSNTLIVFGVDAQSGKLKPTGAQGKVETPLCVVFVPVDPKGDCI